MAENKKSTEFLSKLALLTDAAQDLCNGKVSIIFELNLEDFRNMYLKFEDKVDPEKKQFKVDISGTDFIFILDES